MQTLNDIALYPFGLTSDQIVWWGFVATVVAAACAIWGGVAATAAAKFGKDAPTKADLERVEKNTAHLEEVKANIARMDERMHRQYERAEVDLQAKRASITVDGTGDCGTPLNVRVILQDPFITLSRLELYNEAGTLFGSVTCEKFMPTVYKATIDSEVAHRWFQAGTFDPNAFQRRSQLRAYLLVRGEEVYRQFPVQMSQVSVPEINMPSVVHQCLKLDASV